MHEVQSMSKSFPCFQHTVHHLPLCLVLTVKQCGDSSNNLSFRDRKNPDELATYGGNFATAVALSTIMVDGGVSRSGVSMGLSGLFSGGLQYDLASLNSAASLPVAMLTILIFCVEKELLTYRYQYVFLLKY